MTHPQGPPAPPAWRTRVQSPLLQERAAKADALRARGLNPFANDFTPTHSAADLYRSWGALEHDALEASGVEVRVGGRVRFVRRMGRALFVKIQDRSCRPGSKPAWQGEAPSDDFLQLFVSEAAVGAEVFEALQTLDLGDIVGATGTLMRTKRGELSVAVAALRVVTKAIRPLPAKFGGMQDVELRYRQRYVDLILHEDAREVFFARVAVVRALRNFFDERGFLEVETPMLHPVLGGANARPFTTHHNALNMPLYLRIAPELHLKRLLVGGMERVYEINRNFRNEGLSRQHNPEFTMMEFYQAWATCDDLLPLTEAVIIHVAHALNPRPWTPEPDEQGEIPANAGVHLRDGALLVRVDGRDVSLEGPWRRLSIPVAVADALGGTAEQVWDLAWLQPHARAAGIDTKAMPDAGAVMYALFEHLLEHTLVQPTFVVDYPASVSPLARRRDSDPRLVDRFELFIAGREIANGFSELNDPEDQYGRFADQLANHAAGDEEAMQMDEDYVRALEYGMPPAAGEGIGIDRLVMLMTGAASIRDVLLFPHMRPEQGGGGDAV
jgi:lysyl-tRNA synthetase class 2